MNLVKKSDDYEHLNVSDIEEVEQVIFEPTTTNKRKLTQEEEEEEENKKKTKLDEIVEKIN